MNVTGRRKQMTSIIIDYPYAARVLSLRDLLLGGAACGRQSHRRISNSENVFFESVCNYSPTWRN